MYCCIKIVPIFGISNFCKRIMDSMKELVVMALNQAHLKLLKKLPQTKQITKSLSLSGVKPNELNKFMKDNYIPNGAYFDGRYNCDTFDDELFISWYIEVPVTDDDLLQFKRNRFQTIAWREVYDTLTSNGYKRVGFNSSLLKKFMQINQYDEFMNENHDLFTEYYSLHFTKKVCQ